MADDYSNTNLTTGFVSVGGSSSGHIETAGDADWFQVSLTAGQTYEIFVVGSQYGGTQTNTLANPILRVLDSSGAALALNDNGYGNNPLLAFTAPTTGIYFLETASATPSATGTYQVSLKPYAALPVLADYLVNGWFSYVASTGNGNSGTPRHWASNSVSVNVSALSVPEQALALKALQLYHDVADISFTFTTGTADITYTNAGSHEANITNWSVSGDFFTSVTINISADFSSSIAVNTDMFQAYLHETGHAMGLGHSGPYNGGSPAFGFTNLYGNETLQYSVMTYFGWPGQNISVITPQMADVFAVQSLYGDNAMTRLGDTTYGFNSTAGADFNFATYGPLFAFTIYDSGGTDMFDASGYSVGQEIDLTPGAWSSIGGLTDNIGIYATTLIEDAVGGSGADMILGNAASNILNGGVGNDILDGGAGADTLIGGQGDDILIVNSPADVVMEMAGQGADTLQTTLTNVSLASYANVENLTYTGTSAFIGQGNAGVNVIFGGPGNDYIYAYDGDDTANGNAGIDVFIMGIGNDTVNGGDGQDYIYGDAGNDTLNGDGGVDVLIGGEGNDTMHGGDEGDYFYGENGDDTGYGEGGNDIFVMAAGNDTAIGGDGQDYFYMGDGNDTLNGGAGVDVMLGEAGDDTFIPGLSVDYVFMGTGSDTLLVDKTTSGVSVLYDFTPGNASSDVINLTGTGWTSFAQVQAALFDYTASGNFCVLAIDGDTSIWFIGVQPSQLTAEDFIFGP